MSDVHIIRTYLRILTNVMTITSCAAAKVLAPISKSSHNEIVSRNPTLGRLVPKILSNSTVCYKL